MKKKTKTTESVPWYTRFEWREHIKWLSPFSCLCIHIRFRSRHASTMKCNYIKCSTFNTFSTHIFRTVAQWHHRISVYFRRVLLIQSKKKQFYCYHDFLSATRFESVLAPYWLTMKWYYSTNRYYVYDIIICDELSVSIYRRKKNKWSRNRYYVRSNTNFMISLYNVYHWL